MNHRILFSGETAIKTQLKKVNGKYVNRNGETFYCIENVDEMPPFFISLVSGDNHWLFCSSKGGLTAGRQQADFCLFPYTTEDKIHDNSEITGSKSVFTVEKSGKHYLWEPFSERQLGVYHTTENLYKNTIGNKLIFESINHDLGIRFEYAWAFSNRFGIVKRAQVENLDEDKVNITILDGLQNIMPANVDLGLQTSRSNLVDAYKKGEIAAEKLGVFSLSANIVDKAEPSESLLATTVWTVGLPEAKRFLNARVVQDFRKGAPLHHQEESLGGRCAFFSLATVLLKGQTTLEWYTIADVNQRHAQIKDTLTHLEKPDEELLKLVTADIAEGTKKLETIVGLADGHQLTSDTLASYRHYNNTLFNSMRGGVFTDEYTISTSDFVRHIEQANYQVFRKHGSFLRRLSPYCHHNDLLEQVAQQADDDLSRLTIEYLPLTYSRRHGDPSRPWNTFHIELENPDGSKKFHYEGNWRDIFQNWEALGYSFPLYFEGFIAKFLNASTIDGFNPYRITSEGIDWEVIEEDDPWSFIGYWGDHQIIYLQKLFEGLERHFPGRLAALLNQSTFVYANVPYRLRSFSDIRKDPQSTIDFDFELADTIAKRETEIGADGKLVLNENGAIIRATLLEKVLTSVLAKLYNYIPDAGIWMNTQRPEWNDANNALVGNGVSMVTLYYLRRHLAFLSQVVSQYQGNSFDISRPLYDLLKEVHEIFNNLSRQATISDAARYTYVEALGKAGEHYRSAVYTSKQFPTRKTSIARIQQFIAVAQQVTEQCIAKNKRTDGLYHAYNLISFESHQASIDRLYKMLEGQVGAISSLALDATEVSNLLNSLKNSNLYREDQYSYLLYPNRKLAAFLEKNTVVHTAFLESQLIQRLLAEKNYQLVEKASDGSFHFHASIKNIRDLKNTLEKLIEDGYKMEVLLARDQAYEAYEDTFNHRAFTGRSGTFFGYEGLGSIYWHMVSKLLLAIQETLFEAREMVPETLGNLIAHYYEIRAGIGINKAPDVYGAFPTDPYSHTPANQGVKQPGMTGQVKEDVLNRWAELGVQVLKGRLQFLPKLLRKEEFLTTAMDFKPVAGTAQKEPLALTPGQLGFTYCGVPIVFNLAEKTEIEVVRQDGQLRITTEMALPQDISREIFSRSHAVKQIVVHLKADQLL